MTGHLIAWYASRMAKTMTATQFKAQCLAILEEVREGGEVVITKRGKPVAKLVPVQRTYKTLRGAWKGRIRITGDIVNFDTSDMWDVLK